MMHHLRMKILADYLTDHFHSVQVPKTEPLTLELALSQFPINKSDIPARELEGLFRRNNIQPDGMIIDGPNKDSITTFAFCFDSNSRKDVTEIASHIQAIYGAKPPVAAVA